MYFCIIISTDTSISFLGTTFEKLAEIDMMTPGRNDHSAWENEPLDVKRRKTEAIKRLNLELT